MCGRAPELHALTVNEGRNRDCDILRYCACLTVLWPQNLSLVKFVLQLTINCKRFVRDKRSGVVQYLNLFAGGGKQRALSFLGYLTVTTRAGNLALSHHFLKKIRFHTLH
jgi:hypothetical protein